MSTTDFRAVPVYSLVAVARRDVTVHARPDGRTNNFPQLPSLSGSIKRRALALFNPTTAEDVSVHISAVEKAGHSTFAEGARVGYE